MKHILSLQTGKCCPACEHTAIIEDLQKECQMERDHAEEAQPMQQVSSCELLLL
jgi:hypothetical protein